MHYKFIHPYSCDNNKKRVHEFAREQVVCMGQFEERRGKR